MKLLNIGCGSMRPQEEYWWNLDNLHSLLHHGTPERDNLNKEDRYVNHDLLSGPLPFKSDSIDGVSAFHCLEHLTLHDSVKVIRECRRVLKPGGVLMVSVPDATVFKLNHHLDTIENAERLFGEPIFLGDGETTFMGYAGFTHNHLQLFTEDSMWCCLVRGCFPPESIKVFRNMMFEDRHPQEGTVIWHLVSLLNRLPFSLVMCGVKE